MSNSNGAWIFLSHSTKDWHEVRRVRNLLEEKGHRPLVFFLKYLTEQSELNELIKREIEPRNWFLLCDSKNALQSSWVQKEVACIKTLPDKYHETIDLNDPIESQIQRIDRLCKRLTVFLSYAHADEAHARRIQEALERYEYSVWIDTSLAADSNWMQEIMGAIDRAVERGFVLVLLSPNSVKLAFTLREIQYAFDKAGKAAHGANIIPVIISNPYEKQAGMSSGLQSLLGGIQWFDFSHGDFDRNIENLIAHMKNREMD
jgi:hypothetical protein